MTEFTPGMWFDMPEEEYHAIPALSASGIKNLLVSPLDFWARCPWLNPDYEEEPSDALVIGSAWDTLITGGEEAFNAHYAPTIDPADYPNALRTAEDFKAVLKAAGEKVSGTKADLRARVLEINPAAEIWDDIKAEHEAAHEGKTFLRPDTIADIHKSAAFILGHPQLRKCFTGGHPQVVVCWHDEEMGVPMKIRTDYLKPLAIIDLKTFANVYRAPVDKAIAKAMASQKYHIQATLYMRGVAAGVELMAEGKTDADGETVDRFRKVRSDDRRFIFVFQEKGVAPNTRGKIFPRYQAHSIAEVQIRQAAHTYRTHMETFGTDPWVDTGEITVLVDEDFPPWAFD